MKQILLSIFFFSLFIPNQKEVIQRMNKTSFSSEIISIDSLVTEVNDTILNKTLLIYSDKNGHPVKYSRNIITGVCIDGKCRMVKINLFWNLTGRYLGFELPDGEFLSKTQHLKFNQKEYDLLHILLNDNLSALANYEFKDLVPKINSSKNKVDAVSSATIEAVLDYIVEGAVYTTYTLWHIVYGPTKNEIEKHTSEKLSSELVLKILNSSNLKDQLWVLNHFPAKMEISTSLQNKLMELISGKDIYLAERSINALKTENITSDIQLKLAKIFQRSGFLQKRLILQKLKETDNLNPDAVRIISTELNDLNASLIKSLCELYQVHCIKDSETILEVTKLLKHKNRTISNEAFRYLESIDNLDKRTQKAVDKYKRTSQSNWTVIKQ